jgi:hypothetical protein
MKEIQSVQMWNNGQAVEATILNAYAVNVTLGTAATFWWGLLDESKVVLTQGNLNMTGEDYTKWGANDSYAWEFIATTLNLTIIGDYVPPMPELIVPTEPTEHLNSILADLRQDAPIDEIVTE